MKNYSIAEARNRLPRLVHEAESGRPVGLMRRGHAVAVVVAADDYRRLTAPVGTAWNAIENFRKRFDTAEMAIDPDQVFQTDRRNTVGRKVKL